VLHIVYWLCLVAGLALTLPVVFSRERFDPGDHPVLIPAGLSGLSGFGAGGLLAVNVLELSGESLLVALAAGAGVVATAAIMLAVLGRRAAERATDGFDRYKYVVTRNDEDVRGTDDG
jgi:hypothetical protein